MKRGYILILIAAGIASSCSPAAPKLVQVVAPAAPLPPPPAPVELPQPPRPEILDVPCRTGRLPLAKARNLGARRALAAGADLLIFLDVD